MDIEPLAITPHVEALMDLAYQEDLGNGDITSDLLFPDTHRSVAELEARQSLVLAGLTVACAFFKKVDPDLTLDHNAKDGDALEYGDLVLTIEGPTKSILRAERTVLNFLQNLSGIATMTRRFVEASSASNPQVRIVDTRKTVPGFRYLAKHAVRCGGGLNHRFNLSDAAMLKDNHIAATGSIENAVQRLRAKIPHTTKIEVEADLPDQAREAVAAGADIILLDNMSPDQIRELVQELGDQATLEASGGMELRSIADYAATGVHVISIGAITHSAPAADLSLNFR